MPGFNLIRKRRRRLPVTKVLVGVLVVAALGAGGYFGYMYLGAREMLGTGGSLDVHVVDKGPLSSFRPEAEGDYLTYAAVDEAAGKFARGAWISFTVLPRVGDTAPVMLETLSVEVRQFTPLDAMASKPTYDPPLGSTDPTTVANDVRVRLRLADGEVSSVSWSSQEGFSVPDGDRDVKPLAVARRKVTLVPLLEQAMRVPLANINKPDTRVLQAQVVLDTPGEAVVGIRVGYVSEGRDGAVSSDASVTLVYNPAHDYGSSGYLKHSFEAAPSFSRARAYRDALLGEGKRDEALQVALKHREAEPGGDADWLVGDTYRSMGEHQKAADEGLFAFYSDTKGEYETAGEGVFDLTRTDQKERLARWQEVKSWLTEMVQNGKIKRAEQE